MPLFIADIVFLHPVRLAALAVVVVVMAAAIGSTWQAARWRRIVVPTLRALAVALLAFAWAAPVVREETSNNWIAFVVDQSPSTGGGAYHSAEEFIESDATDQAAQSVWYGVGQGPLQEADSLAALATGEFGGDLFGAGRPTLADAVRRAAAQARSDGAGQVVIFTDGYEAQAPAAAEQLLAAASISAEIPMHVVPVPALPGDTQRIDRLVAPLEADVGEEFAISAAGPSDAAIEFQQDGQPLPPGDEPGTAKAKLSQRQPATITARMVGVDGVPENNQKSIVVLPAPKKRVLLVSEQPGQVESFVRLLRLGDFEVTTLPLREFPPRDGVLQYDAMVLANVAARELSTDAAQELHEFLAAGGGLVTLGGEATFGREALAGAPLEPLLPLVAAERPQQQRNARLGLVLVIDNSRSMLEANRMKLAKQAAVKAMEPLDDNDLLGVIAFGDQSDWISEMIPAGETGELRGRIDKLEAIGTRTIMYPAIRKAYLALAAANVDRRNMIILTDGVSAPGDFAEIAQEMARLGITVSTVSVSAGADQTILRQIAEIAQGRHHHADDPADLPKIVLAETTSAAEEAAAELIRPLLVESLPGIALAELPPLAGLTPTDLRAGSQLFVMSPDGDPLLSMMPSGQGKSLALAVDLNGPAAEQWRGWSEYPSLLPQLVRAVERGRRPRATDLLLDRHGDQLRIRLDAHRQPAAWRRVGQAAARVELPGGESATLPMKLIAPAMYEASFPLPAELAEGEVVVVQTNLRIDGASEAAAGWEAQGAYVVDYDAELGVPSGQVNETLLRRVAELTGGIYNVSPGTLPAGKANPRVEYRPLWPWFALGALLVFVAEIGIRQVGR